jgi:hypothetical protein
MTPYHIDQSPVAVEVCTEVCTEVKGSGDPEPWRALSVGDGGDTPMYGTMTPEMEALVAPHVQGKVVWDLGAGDLWHSKMLLRRGASWVMAVDKWGFTSDDPVFGVTRIEEYFQFVKVPVGGIDVAYLSWPDNLEHLPGLINILEQSRVVVYVGSNMDGTSCGNKELFTHLSSREVLGHIPLARNSMIIYGGVSSTPRELLPEEWAGIYRGRRWTLEEATRAAKSAP